MSANILAGTLAERSHRDMAWTESVRDTAVHMSLLSN